MRLQALRSALPALLLSVLVCGTPAAYGADGPGTVLITGANRGIGLALAREYALRGWKVIGTARRPEDAKELREIGAQIIVEPLDTKNHASIDALAAKYRGTPIDVLINNAGISGGLQRQSIGDLDYDMGREVFETNFMGPIKIAEAFMPNVEASKTRKLITISSNGGSIGSVRTGGLYFYRSSKAAVNMVMRNLALDVQSRGVIVASISPGPVATDMMKGVTVPGLQSPQESARKVIAIIDALSLENTGRFWHHAGGELPW